MELYKIGKVASVGKTYIIFDANYSGHILYVARPQDYTVDKEKVQKIYVFEHRTEYAAATYGFKSFSERILFEDLLSVSGVGPKTALNILKEGVDNVIALIAKGDAKALANIPLLGMRSASQIVFELKGKYEKTVATLDKSMPLSSELRSSLKVLGFNPRQIDYALANVKASGPIDVMIEEAIKAISSAKFA